MLFKVKDGVKLGDIQEFQPALMLIFTYVVLYCHKHQLPCVISSLIQDRDKVNAKSMTHEEGRAFDLSLHGISTFHVERLVYHVNKKFNDIGAISAETGFSNPAEDKLHGTGPHIHFQVRPHAQYEQLIF